MFVHLYQYQYAFKKLASGLFTLLGNGTRIGTGIQTSKIGNNGSWFGPLNIYEQYIGIHYLYLSRSRSHAV